MVRVIQLVYERVLVGIFHESTFQKFRTKIRKQIKNETCMIRVYYIYFQKNRDKKYGNIYILFKKR